MSPALAVLGTFSWGGLDPSDFDFITSVNFATSSAVNINGCFSADYDHYLVMRDLLGSAADNAINARLRASSTDDSGSNYRYQYLSAASTSVAGGRSTAQTLWSEAFGNTETTRCGFAALWVSNPFGAVRTTAFSTASKAATGNILMNTYAMEHDLATSYDGISFISQSGTITGDVFVYGLAV